MDPVLTDAELVKAVLAGKGAAYGDLIRRYERSVRAATLAVLGDFHAAEDATQETFVVAYRKLDALLRPSAFGAWVLRIAHRQALRAVRKHRAAETLDPNVAVQAPHNGRLDEDSEGLLTAVAALPEHERRVVMLHYFDGHSVAVISAMCGRPLGTVTKQLARARERLRGRLCKEAKP